VRQGLHAEWTKQRTVPATGWLLLLCVALTIAPGIAATAAAVCPSAQCGQDPARVNLTGIDLGQAAVAILGVLAMGGEYSTGTVQVTLLAVPHRATLLTSKAAVLAGMVLIAGTLAVLGAVLAGQVVLPSHGFTAAHGYAPLSASSCRSSW
jgi:ABC-2 type transport system permease protein